MLRVRAPPSRPRSRHPLPTDDSCAGWLLPPRLDSGTQASGRPRITPDGVSGVGGQRGITRSRLTLFRPPLPEPCVQLSPHTALQMAGSRAGQLFGITPTSLPCGGRKVHPTTRQLPILAAEDYGGPPWRCRYAQGRHSTRIGLRDGQWREVSPRTLPASGEATARRCAATRCTMIRIVSWLTPYSAARSRRLAERARSAISGHKAGDKWRRFWRGRGSGATDKAGTG